MSCCPLTGCRSAACGLGLTRIGVGLFFALFGAMKLFAMGPSAFQAEIIEGGVGLSGFAALAATWLVIAFELVGGIIILLGKIVKPQIAYRVSLLGLTVITVVSFLTVHSPDAMQFLWHGMLFLVLLGLIYSPPMCPCGITGCKSENECHGGSSHHKHHHHK